MRLITYNSCKCGSQKQEKYFKCTKKALPLKMDKKYIISNIAYFYTKRNYLLPFTASVHGSEAALMTTKHSTVNKFIANDVFPCQGIILFFNCQIYLSDVFQVSK